MSNPATELKRMIEAVTATGSKEIDLKSKDVKGIKKVAKNEPASLPMITEQLLYRLNRPHAQIRLSAFQLLDHLFRRSHQLRQAVVDNHLQAVVQLSVGTDGKLPPPKEAADIMKKTALEAIKHWVQEYGEGYKKLKLAFNYLKEVKKVDFQALEARSEAARRAESERNRRQDNVWRERVRRVKTEMSELRPEIEDCHTQVRNCLGLLMPPEEDIDSDDGGDDNLRAHGVLNPGQSIAISVPSRPQIEETADNAAVLENLRDQGTLLKNRLLPTVRKWAVILTKAGNVGEAANGDVLKKVIDLKQLLEEANGEAEGVIKGIKSNRGEGDSDSDSDDFVEVPPLDEDELEMLATGASTSSSSSTVANALGIPFYSTAAAMKKNSTPLPPLKRKYSSSTSWSLNADNEEEMDPTTLRATLSKLKKKSLVESPSKPSTSTSTLSAPVRPSDWTDEKRGPQKVAVDSDRLRFWGGSTSQEADELIVPGSDSNARSIAFTGKFEPVRWSCRAPLPSGRLCPRRDRVKCPLHGKIIGRDNVGEPSEIEDKMRLEEERMQKKQEKPDWQDPELLRDLKASTGIDLAMPAKRGDKTAKAKEKRRKHPGLVDLRHSEDSVRKRLEKRVFNRGSMKRVAADMTKLEGNRGRDKFGDQFNYIFN